MLLYFLIKSNFILAKRKIFQTHHIYKDEAKTNIYFKKREKTEMEVNTKKNAPISKEGRVGTPTGDEECHSYSFYILI